MTDHEEHDNSDSDRPEKGLGGLWTHTKETFEVMSYTPKGLALLWRAHKGLTLAVLFLSLLSAIIPLAELELTKLVLDSLTLSQTLKIPYLNIAVPFINFGTLIFVGGMVSLGWIYMAVVSPLMWWTQDSLGDVLTKNVTSLVLHKTNSFADITVFETSSFYDTLTKVESQAGYRPMTIMHELVAFMRNVVNLISMSIVILLYQPWLLLWIIGLSTPALIAQMRHQRETAKLGGFEKPEVRKMSYSKVVLTTDYMAKEVRLFGLGDHFLARYMNAYDTHNAGFRKLRLAHLRENFLLGTLAVAGIGGGYSFIALSAITHAITLGAFTLYTAAVDRITGHVQALFYNMTQMYECNLFVRDLYTFLALPLTMEVLSPEFAQHVPKPILQGIEFKDVKFGYPNSDKKILDGLSFTIKPGQTVALVGENGAGKTTIVKLLARLYDVDEGKILIDGVDLRDYNLDEWRAQLGVIFQDFNHFELTARENIGLGRLPLLHSIDSIKSAADKGGAAEIIDNLPKKYDTYLGTFFNFDEEKSAELSGGEWQRVALARAFMRSLAESKDGDNAIYGVDAYTLRAGDAQLLILDEPTAALDAKAEAEVYTRFHELTKGKSTLLISHRFSTVRMADHIIVLDSGRVIEQGSHKELLELGGEYAKMYNLQADRYKD